ncbi:hypothetical protein SEPCBS119000_004396 [Sporothrix epigloea]|uniref:Uncharacterized protein n=1 Tax=Sporothrix epigloea TaxID=1892477 RepID=A0ABP0DVS8_9PEZI
MTHSEPQETSTEICCSPEQSRHGAEKGNLSTAPNRRSTKASNVPASESANAKSIILGYWRDSPLPNEADRHAVTGLIDTRGRLRTRVHQLSRSGDSIPSEYPYPSGGGSWVSFEHVVFDKHLIGLNHQQMKEYVKIRTESLGNSETPEETVVAEHAAVKEAMHRAATHPTTNNHLPAQIAYGTDLPDYELNASRPEKKRRASSRQDSLPLTASNISSRHSLQHANDSMPQTGSQPLASAAQLSATDPLHGTRPAKILLGYWRGSSEEHVEDKHAVFGILGSNDMFRVKVARETRDGRTVQGNFPQGAGALWIHYDEVEFEEHIRHLSRLEVKEYVRVRQRQIDDGEEAADRVGNEKDAVHVAQSRVFAAGGAAQSTLGTTGRLDSVIPTTAASLGRSVDRNELEDNGGRLMYSDLPNDVQSWCEQTATETYSFGQTMGANEPDASIPTDAANRAFSFGPLEGGQYPALSVARMSAESKTSGLPLSHDNRESSYNIDRLGRSNDPTRRIIDTVETLNHNNSRWAGDNEAGYDLSLNKLGNRLGLSANDLLNAKGPQTDRYGHQIAAGGFRGSAGNVPERNIQSIEEDVGQLKNTWASQDALRLRMAGSGDVKILNGVKYERKSTGPFKGKLVSPGIILSLDGEDYVEYRVLTKPTFF